THADPEQARIMRQIEARHPVDLSAKAGPGAAIRAGRVELQSAIADDWLMSCAADAEHAARLRQLDWASVVIVPLTARGRTLGAISMGMAKSAAGSGAVRRWELTDLGLAEDLASRAATAIDISRLYDERSQVARKLL